MFCNFRKPMASRAVVAARSAFTLREQKNILLREGIRMVRNCHPGLSWEEKRKFLSDFNLSMLEAGHD